MARRIYVVAEDGSADKRLVRATSPSQAVRHVAQIFSARPATAEDVAHLLGNGVHVEGAGEQQQEVGE